MLHLALVDFPKQSLQGLCRDLKVQELRFQPGQSGPALELM